jgi:hypothetical protein
MTPVPKEWTDFLTMTPGLEEIPGVLYDTVDYTSAVTTTLTLFDAVRVGRLDLSNMKAAGHLSYPESFLAQNLRVYFKTSVMSDDSGAGDSTAAVSQFGDLVNLVNGGVLQLQIGEKQYGPWPLWVLPAHNFVKGAFSTGSDLIADYGQIDGFLYPLEPNLVLAPLQPFIVTLSWPGGAVTLSTGSESTIPIEVLFDGKKARAVQ